MCTPNTKPIPGAVFLTLLGFLTTSSHAQITNVSAPPSTTTDSGNYAEPTSSPSFANYYFVLIGLLLVFVILGYFTLRRARKRARARRIAAASGVPIHTGTSGRGWWRNGAVTEPRREEGLDERGEAPPPYVTGDLAGPSRQVELRDLGTKPPDYEGLGGEGVRALMRPAPTYPVQGRFA